MFQEILNWLNTGREVFGLATNNLELLAFVTGVVTVWLCVKNHILNWPFGILNSFIFLFVFFDAGLYADAYLMIFYIVTGVYGWYWWTHGGRDKTDLPVRRLNFLPLGEAPTEERRFDNLRNNFWLAAIVTGVAWYIMGTSVDRFTDSNVAFWDAGTTALSLMAQYFLMRRLVENWYVWITVDVAYIGLYWYKDLKFSSILYVIFLLLCIKGVIDWMRINRTEVRGPVPQANLALEAS